MASYQFTLNNFTLVATGSQGKIYKLVTSNRQRLKIDFLLLKDRLGVYRPPLDTPVSEKTIFSYLSGSDVPEFAFCQMETGFLLFARNLNSRPADYSIETVYQKDSIALITVPDPNYDRTEDTVLRIKCMGYLGQPSSSEAVVTEFQNTVFGTSEVVDGQTVLPPFKEPKDMLGVLVGITGQIWIVEAVNPYYPPDSFNESDLVTIEVGIFGSVEAIPVESVVNLDTIIPIPKENLGAFVNECLKTSYKLKQIPLPTELQDEQADMSVL